MSKEVMESSMLDGRLKDYDRYLRLAKMVNNLLMIAGGAIFTCALLGVGIVWVASQQKVVPYVVEVNGNSEVVRVGRADVAAAPTDNQVMASLRMMVIGARTVFLDRRAQEKEMNTAYSMILAGSPALKAMEDFHKENNPYQRSKTETVQVEVNSVPKISNETWQVEFTETTSSISGKVISVRKWQGTFKVKIIPQNDSTQIGANPFGIYVEWFSWTTRI